MNNPVQILFVELRIALRILQETLGGLKRSGWMNLVVSITMGSILSIFGLLFLGITQVQDIVKGLGSSLEISVYLEPDADVSGVTDEIRKQPYVSAIELVSKEDALADMRKTYQVPALEQNPLPDTLHVNVTDARTIEQAVGTLKQIDGVEEVRYAYDIVERIQSIARFLSFTGLALLLYLGALTVFIISNTIHLLIEARGREIEILRMMGVSNWYIRLPFLLQGATYGLFGSLLGLIPLFYATEYGRMIYEALSLKQHSVSLLAIFSVMFILGATVGSGGAALSMRRYMRI
ncbi:MAG: cell division protein FtsX [Vampirovibrionales bacterium]